MKPSWDRFRLPSRYRHAGAAVLRQVAVQWHQLSSRERRLVVLAGVCVAVACLWLIVLQPALAGISRWQAEIPALRSQAQELERILADVPSPRAAGRVGEAASEAALQDSLERAGLTGQYQIRWQAQDAVAVRIELENAAPQALMPWLLAEPGRLGYAISALRIVRQEAQPSSEGGRLSGTVDLMAMHSFVAKEGS